MFIPNRSLPNDIVAVYESQIEATTNKKYLMIPHIGSGSDQHILPNAMENFSTFQSASLSSKELMEIDYLFEEHAEDSVWQGLPQEILQEICFYLDLNDLTIVRLVSHASSHAAAVHLFRELSFSIEPSSIEKIINVARSSKLQGLVRCLRYKTAPNHSGSLSDDLLVGFKPSWIEKSLEQQERTRSELDEALIKLGNLKAIRISCIKQVIPDSHPMEQFHQCIFNQMRSVLTSSLRNIPKLRALQLVVNKASHRVFSELDNDEKKMLGHLQEFSLLFYDFEIVHAMIHQAMNLEFPALMDYLFSLRSLDLNTTGPRDFSELVNPATRFQNLTSLSLTGFYLNEQYFKEFLLAHAHTLRSLSLVWVRLECTVEEYDQEFDPNEYITTSNPWIRMFHFLGESMHLNKIVLSGGFETTLCGTWSVSGTGEGIDPDGTLLCCRLTQFITHAEGSSFPLPHPDVKLNEDILRKLGDQSLSWRNPYRRSGFIRRLEREASKPAAFDGIMRWRRGPEPSDSESEDMSSEDEIEGDESQYDSDEDSDDGHGEDEDSAATDTEMDGPATPSVIPTLQGSAFRGLKALLLRTNHTWTDEERTELANLMNEEDAADLPTQ